jgi:ferrous iron transport protein A
VSTGLDEVTGTVLVTCVGGEPATRRRLAEMGVRPGARITVLHRSSGGGRVLAVDGARIAVDAQLAASIEAAPTDD